MKPTRRIRIDSYVSDADTIEIVSRISTLLQLYIKTTANKPFKLENVEQYNFVQGEKKRATFTIRHSKHFIIIQIFPI